MTFLEVRSNQQDFESLKFHIMNIAQIPVAANVIEIEPPPKEEIVATFNLTSNATSPPVPLPALQIASSEEI